MDYPRRQFLPIPELTSGSNFWVTKEKSKDSNIKSKHVESFSQEGYETDVKMKTKQINQSKKEQLGILNNILNNQELINKKFSVCVQEKRM